MRALSLSRLRLMLLVLLATAPALGLTLYTYLEERRAATARAQESALRLARLASDNQERLVDGTRHLLMALAQLPQLRPDNGAACRALLARLLQHYPLYSNLGAIARDGMIYCSGVRTSGPVFAGDRIYFRRALETGDFAVGEYQIGRITGRASVNFGLPVVDEAGRPQAVVFAALDLAWLTQYAAQAELPQGAELSVIDRNGTVLVRYPDAGAWIGKSVPDAPIVKAILARQGAGMVEAVDVDGLPRLFAFARFGDSPAGGTAYVSVGIPTAVAFADVDRTLIRNLTVLAIVAVLALAAARAGAEMFILRPVNALVAATRRVSAGDLRARTGLPHGPGELNQLACAFDDMAESLEQAEGRRRQEEELRRKNFELEQHNRSIQEANRLKGEFVSMVSHELRTPLTSIQGYIALLLQGESGELAAEQREFLIVVQNNAERLLALINDLLDLARIEAGRIELHRATLDLARLVQDVARALRPLIEGKQQQLTLDLPPALPPVWADANRVAQVVTNLLSNAHKYTPAGGSIRVTVRAADGTVGVEVRDTGIGLSAEEQAQCFAKFFRAKDRRAQEAGGTGLGLAISRSLVELHGGHITVSSAPGQGSTFSVTLPVCQPPPVQEETETAARVAQRHPGARILVVDDEPDVANLIRRYLERGGCEVLLARDGVEALRVARAEHPELITLDILLPDADGFTVLEWLKADPATERIPVLLLSVVDNAERGTLLGAVDYLVKPVREQVLLERVGRILAADPAPVILLADDDADMRALLPGHLRRAGYRVVEAAEGAQAVAFARRHRPDLALIDVEMPGTDGVTALRALRADTTTRELPVIMITASPGVAGESRSVIDAFGGELLLKPVSAEELTKAIQRGLASAQVPRSPVANSHPPISHPSHPGPSSVTDGGRGSSRGNPE